MFEREISVFYAFFIAKCYYPFTTVLELKVVLNLCKE